MKRERNPWAVLLLVVLAGPTAAVWAQSDPPGRLVPRASTPQEDDEEEYDDEGTEEEECLKEDLVGNLSSNNNTTPATKYLASGFPGMAEIYFRRVDGACQALCKDALDRFLAAMKALNETLGARNDRAKELDDVATGYYLEKAEREKRGEPAPPNPFGGRSVSDDEELQALNEAVDDARDEAGKAEAAFKACLCKCLREPEPEKEKTGGGRGEPLLSDAELESMIQRIRPGGSAGERDPEGQLMAGEATTAEVMDNGAPPSLGHRLWARLRTLFTPPAALLAARHHAAAFDPGTRPIPAAAASPLGPLVLVTGLGGYTGDVLQMQVLDRTGQPLRLSAGAAFVMEPLTKRAQEDLRKEFEREARKQGGHAATLRLNGYCLEYLKQPPAAGTVLRIAGMDVQRRHASMRRILAASRRLDSAGQLKPDMNRRDYLDAVRQWALWTREQGFTQESFGKAFVEQTKKNVTAAGRPWNKQVEEVVRRAVPGRWAAIVQILAAAEGKPSPSASP